MLSRKVVTRSGRGYRGYFPSRKLNRMVQYESLLEKKAIQFFEKNTEVISFQEQPERSHYYDHDDQLREYYPDFLLILESNHKLYVEIKPISELAKLKDKFELILEAYKTRNEILMILTDVDLRHEPPKCLLELIFNPSFRSLKRGAK